MSIYNRLNSFLLVAWDHLNTLCSQPITALFAFLWVFGSFGANQHTNNHYDPGMLYTNFFQNALQLVLLFVACSLAYAAGRHAKQGATHASEARVHAGHTRQHAQETHQLVKEIHATIHGTGPHTPAVEH